MNYSYSERHGEVYVQISSLSIALYALWLMSVVALIVLLVVRAKQR